MRIIVFFICFCLLFSCKEEVKSDISKAVETIPKSTKVEVKEKSGKFQLLVNSEPFYIKGAGLEYGNVKALANHKANSFRTWRTDNGQKSAKQVLDEAYENGLMVTMGIEVERERHGFDYDDEKAVKEQLERIKKEVLELKNHPALLIWGIGNELNLHYTNPKVWDAVNDISKMIHSIDGNHPTTTSLAGISQKEINYIKDRCSDLDILSIQMYGDLPSLPKMVKESGWTGPYMITEWGATGHWEVPKTQWNAPIEENSTVKANNYLKRYNKGIAANSNQCIGSYVFLWGNKQERTPTWYGIFLEDGKETQSVDVMHYIWNGKWPENRTPIIENYTIDGKTAYENVTLQEGKEYKALVEVSDFENDSLVYSWEVLQESKDLKHGGDEEDRPESIKGLFVSENNGSLSFKAPSKGEYRLFVYATDGQHHAATANIPFKVE